MESRVVYKKYAMKPYNEEVEEQHIAEEGAREVELTVFFGRGVVEPKL